MSSKKLTVLFTPLEGWGHINCCHGLAEGLKNRGHRVVFALEKHFENKLIEFGFEEQLYCMTSDVSSDESDKYFWAQFVEKHSQVFKLEPIEVIRAFSLPALKKMFADIKDREQQYRDIIDRVNPDIIIIANYVCSPILTNSGIPWVWLFPAAPHWAFNDERVIPPGWSGLSLNGNRNDWNKFSDEFQNLFNDLNIEINEYLISKDCPKLENSKLHPLSPYLNIYFYSKELDYEELKPLANNWKRVENFIRSTNESFQIPESLRERPGKLIYLSMGSFGCANLELMTRLITILAKSQHRFIVSKGPLHDKYELPDNMWGQRFLPQTAVIPVVDLVITHGGNNTVTETFYFGKPMIVMPLFADQLDNAQRVEETDLGLRLNPFHCTQSELLIAVDRLVSDHSLAERMTTIGQRIRKSDDKKVVSELIENLFK